MNTYTKGLLLLIALFLGIIACRPSFQSDSTLAQNSAKLNIQVLCGACALNNMEGGAFSIILDQNTGKVWAYRYASMERAPIYLGMMSEVGKQIQKQ